MAKPVSNLFLLLLLLLVVLFIHSIPSAIAIYDILSFGAKPDGQTDSTTPFLNAWAAACGSTAPATISVPQGRFLVGQAILSGPCKNNAIKFMIKGTIVAPSNINLQRWIQLSGVNGVSISGGTLDGQGTALWACKTAGRSCPLGATSLGISHSQNVVISGLTSINSKLFHIAMYGCDTVTINGVKINAPDDSPNTDGIHVQGSTGVTITGTDIKTGDDCISIGSGTTNLWMERITCGPGHGISIGSLGNQVNEPGVQNVTAKGVVFTGTTNGLRIKAWAKPSYGFVKGVVFQHAIMQNVQNPIVIIQNYCPTQINCPTQTSGVQISDVTYNDIQGSSASQVAVSFDCSPSHPCRGITLVDVKLTYQNQPAQASCKYADGSSSGVVSPPSCL